MITVVSTGLHPPTARLCIASVQSQVDVEFEHRWVDAADQSPQKTVSENLFEIIGALPASRIVVWLDLDDWLAHSEVLARVQAMHDAGALVTYGQFMELNGASGFAAPYYTDEPRKEPWKATHLKTFRAGLFQRIRKDDLQLEGQWLELAVDMAIMFPLLEMAGRDRAKFCSEVLCIYNRASSFAETSTAEQKDKEKRVEGVIRARRRYAPFTGALE